MCHVANYILHLVCVYMEDTADSCKYSHVYLLLDVAIMLLEQMIMGHYLHYIYRIYVLTAKQYTCIIPWCILMGGGGEFNMFWHN